MSRKSSSPSLRLIEFTTGLPCTHFSPASMTDHFELSIITGTRAISGSVATRLRNRVIVSSESSSASSMLTSMRFAPPRTWSRATSVAAARSPDLTRRAKRADPVTLVRSPTIRNVPSSRTVRVSSPLKPTRSRLAGGDRARRRPVDGAGDGRDVLRGGAAATAEDVHEPALRELPEQPRRLVRRLVVLAEGVGQPGVRVAAHPALGDGGQLRQVTAACRGRRGRS